MAEYRNETASAQVIGGKIMVPKVYVELDDNIPGLQRMVKRGVVSRKGAAPQQTSSQGQGESLSAGEEALRNMMLDEIEYLTGNRPGARSKFETLQKSLQEAREQQLKERAEAQEQAKADSEAAEKDGSKQQDKE